MLDYFNTFTDNPGSSFFSLDYSSSPPSCTYNAAVQALDVFFSGYTYNLWICTGVQPAYGLSDFSFEVDLEFVAGYSTYRDLGVYLVASRANHAGYAFRCASNVWSFSKSPSFGVYTALLTGFSTQTFNVGDRHLLKVVRTSGTYTLFIDGVLVASVFNADYKDLIPGVFFTGGTIRIHSINWSYFGVSEVTAGTFKSQVAWANNETSNQAWPGEIAIKKPNNSKPVKYFKLNSPPDFNAPPARKTLGFIGGIVTRKGQIASGQNVVCLDSRFNLVAETTTAADGAYRFDSLINCDTYIVIAQDNWDFKYAPVGADRRTPEAYP